MPNTIAFRHRAHEVSRVEAFSDVVFGFAISLLVVSLEAPKSYRELMETLRGFLPFAISFFILIQIWFEHHDFYKRYALHDTGTMILNTMLLFTAVFWLLAAMFLRAYAKREELGLNDVERIDTRESIYDNFFMGIFGVLSMIVAQFAPSLAGPIYFLICVPKTLVPMIMRRKRRRYEAQACAILAQCPQD